MGVHELSSGTGAGEVGPRALKKRHDLSTGSGRKSSVDLGHALAFAGERFRRLGGLSQVRPGPSLRLLRALFSDISVCSAVAGQGG